MPQTKRQPKRRTQWKAVRSQPRIPGVKRLPMYTAVLPILEKDIRKDMIDFGVSRSYVIAVALATVYKRRIDSFK